MYVAECQSTLQRIGTEKRYFFHLSVFYKLDRGDMIFACGLVNYCFHHKGLRMSAKKILLEAVGVSLLAAASSVDASLVLALDDLSTAGVDVIVVDNADGGVGTGTALGVSNTADSAASDGIVVFSGAVGAFGVNVSTGMSVPAIGSGSIDLNSVNVTTSAAGTLRIMLTDTDLLGDPVGFSLNTGGVAAVSLAAEAYLDPMNTEFGTAYAIQSPSGGIGPGAFTFSEYAWLGGPFPGPYSLTTIVTIEHTGAGQITSFDAKVVAEVAEPSILALMGLGLAGIGYRRFRPA